MSSRKQTNRLQEESERREANGIIHNSHHEVHASPSKKVSNIDGIGLWNSFTRSFQSPLMACYDLIDNVFDASSLSNGKLNIDVDVEEFKDDDDKTRVRELELDTTNGFYMLNNCQNPVKPMKDVLTVFNSDKGTAQSQIGENGVGVKQGCATLSDISFVMGRNGRVFSLGILAKCLQEKTGPYIPSFEFQLDSGISNVNDLYEFLMTEITAITSTSGNEDIAAVVKEYGHDNFEKGKYRLVKNMMRMSLSDDDWSEQKYVFCICIHDLKHGENSDLLLNLQNELPKHYLHVPHSFFVWIGSFRVKFNHWPNRLVNLTRFNVRIPKDQEIDKDNLDGSGDGQTSHSLNIYLGFDAIKIQDTSQKPAHLYFYSRKFGRHIKSQPDGRGMLWLSAGGTQYCQALTIIVDDIGGYLPLNPTKQDFAFGEHDNGQVWEQNLLKWVSAVTKVYYNYYLQNSCQNKKTVLTNLVKSRHERANAKQTETIRQDPNHCKAIDERRVSTFEGIEWEFKSHKIAITAGSKKNLKEVIGADIDLVFETVEVSNNAQPGRNSSINVQNGDDERGNADNETYDHDMTMATATATATVTASVRRARRGPKRYREDSEPDDEEDTNVSRTVAPSKSRRLELENAQLKQEVASLTQELSNAKHELRNAKTDIDYLESSERELRASHSRKDRDINRLRRDLDRATRGMDL